MAGTFPDSDDDDKDRTLKLGHSGFSHSRERERNMSLETPHHAEGPGRDFGLDDDTSSDSQIPARQTRPDPLKESFGRTDSSGSPAAGSAAPSRLTADPSLPRRGSMQHSRPAKSVATSNEMEEDLEEKSCRERVNLVFSDPSSSCMARVVSLFFLLLIVMSTLTFVLETVPELSADPDFGDPSRECMWFTIETIFIICFTLEYVVRWVTEPVGNILAFPFETFNIVDIIAILPYYLELTLAIPNTPCSTDLAAGSAAEGPFGSFDLRFVRVVRLARVFRVLKLGRGLNATEVLIQTFQGSQQALMVPFFFLLLGMVVVSSIMYLVEQGNYSSEDGRYYITNSQGHEVEASFPSIPDTLWWALVTMTTVGYGDLYPHTGAGKAVGSMAMMFGTIFFAMPIAIVGAEFTNAWEGKKQRDGEDIKKYSSYKKDKKVVVRPNTKEWGNTELYMFNIRFSDENVSVDEFFGFTEKRKTCVLCYRRGTCGLGPPSLGYVRLKAGLIFELEVLEHKDMLGRVQKDLGLVLARVHGKNPLVETLRAGQFVGRRLIGIRTRTGGVIIDTSTKPFLRGWQRKYPRGDQKGEWADQWLQRIDSNNDKVVFMFETEQEVGERMLRLASPSQLVPEHFNSQLFGWGRKLSNPKHFRRQLTVPLGLWVSSDVGSARGIYEIEGELIDNQPSWRRKGREGVGSAVIQSEDGKWVVRLEPTVTDSTSSHVIGTVALRTRNKHNGNIPPNAGNWDCKNELSDRWQAAPGVAFHAVPLNIAIASSENPDTVGRYRIDGLDEHSYPKWVRCGMLDVADTLSLADGAESERATCAPYVIAHNQGTWEVKENWGQRVVFLRSNERYTNLPVPADTTIRYQWDSQDDDGCWRPATGTRIIEDGDLGQPCASLTHLAYKVYHIKRSCAAASKTDSNSILAEKNINMYTKDFIAQLYHHVGLARLPTGFRSRAGLKIYFGKETVRSKSRYNLDDIKEVTIASDSDMGVFGLAEGKVVPVYVCANQALLDDEEEKKGRIAGELLSLAQNLWLNCNKTSDFKYPVYLITFRGTKIRFYTATFTSEFLQHVSKGSMPETQITVRSFPNRRDGARGECSDATVSDSLRRTTDEIFPETKREADEELWRKATNLDVTMDPRMDFQDGTLRYITMPEADDFGGTSPLRVTRVERGIYGPPVKVGMRLLRVKLAGSKHVVLLNSREDYDNFLWDNCRKSTEVMKVVMTVAEDSDSLDFLKSRERGVCLEMLTRLRLRIIKYLAEDLNEQLASFAPAGTVSRRTPSQLVTGIGNSFSGLPVASPTGSFPRQPSLIPPRMGSSLRRDGLEGSMRGNDQSQQGRPLASLPSPRGVRARSRRQHTDPSQDADNAIEMERVQTTRQTLRPTLSTSVSTKPEFTRSATWAGPVGGNAEDRIPPPASAGMRSNRRLTPGNSPLSQHGSHHSSGPPPRSPARCSLPPTPAGEAVRTESAAIIRHVESCEVLSTTPRQGGAGAGLYVQEQAQADTEGLVISDSNSEKAS
eukprot:Hpha_TRINITY_DN14610_c2_g15::TRINITY_DN14610_c2_g15_i1::g.48378::m.48378